MDKSHTLQAIQNARASHESQMAKISALIKGEVVENPTAVSKIKCDFGKWLYNEDNRVKAILGAQFYETIETLHGKWHAEYSRIFNIFHKEKKKGIFATITGANKISDMDIDKAKFYYAELLVTTKELLKILSVSERRINALSDSKFK